MNITYCFTRRAKKCFLGSLLTVNEFGFPVEFKYTEPVCPTRLQEILYGNRLEKYVCYDIVIPELIKSLENKPDLFVVDSLKSGSLDFPAPAVILYQTSLEPLKELLDTKKIKENECLIQLLRTGSPLRIVFSGEFDKIRDILALVSQNMDILEPIERIEVSFEELQDMFENA